MRAYRFSLRLIDLWINTRFDTTLLNVVSENRHCLHLFLLPLQRRWRKRSRKASLVEHVCGYIQYHHRKNFHFLTTQTCDRPSTLERTYSARPQEKIFGLSAHSFWVLISGLPYQPRGEIDFEKFNNGVVRKLFYPHCWPRVLGKKVA